MLKLVAPLFLLVAAPAAAQPSYPLPGDVASPEALVTAAYESIQRAPGEAFDWERFESLYLPEARLIPNTEQTGGAFTVYTPAGFIAFVNAHTTVGGRDDKGFAEEEVHHVVQRFGDVAHVFSTYQKHFWDDDEILGRGINSFQLVFHDDRWWIAGVVWDEEHGAGPIPPPYLGD